MKRCDRCGFDMDSLRFDEAHRCRYPGFSTYVVRPNVGADVWFEELRADYVKWGCFQS